MTWKDIIENEQEKPYYVKLKEEIDKRYENSIVFPEKENIFKAFTLTPLDNLKVVILGQDPYHGFGQAQGLSFSTPKEIKNPPSMVNDETAFIVDWIPFRGARTSDLRLGRIPDTMAKMQNQKMMVIKSPVS